MCCTNRYILHNLFRLAPAPNCSIPRLFLLSLLNSLLYLSTPILPAALSACNCCPSPPTRSPTRARCALLLVSCSACYLPIPQMYTHIRLPLPATRLSCLSIQNSHRLNSLSGNLLSMGSRSVTISPGSICSILLRNSHTQDSLCSLLLPDSLHCSLYRFDSAPLPGMYIMCLALIP
ncbi:MAG: hypothetical protein BWY95_00976 [Bacteroidetes bacterium ADurb.BinA104]|nr:MAG: hypothetical protein BWY95_00976 [Bacteroidetes bacterium ADurb.BinA104]